MTRLEYVLAVLAAGNGEVLTPVQIQKLFFLLDRKVAGQLGGVRFNFQPQGYGPFDKEVFEDLRELSGQNLISIDEAVHRTSTYRITPAGLARGAPLLAQIPLPMREYIGKLLEWVRGQSFESLISWIYREYPEMSVRGVFREEK